MLKRVMVVGKPASGKSTLIEVLVKHLDERGVATKVVDDYLVLKECCPEEVRSNKYFYRDGNLVLVDRYRDEVMDGQYRLLQKKWVEEYDGVVLLEIANPELAKSVKKYFMNNILESALIMVACNLNEVKNRNSLREVWRQIPEVFLSFFKKSDGLVFKEVEKLFGKSKLISNEDSLVAFENEAVAIAKSIFGE